MKKSKKKLINVNYGIASSYNDFIEINCKLTGKLRNEIIKHELRHDNNKYTLADFKNDFQSKKPHFFQSFKFALKNKEALINYFPFMYSYYSKSFTYNLSCIYPFLQLGFIFSVFFYIFLKVNLLNSLFGFFNLVVIINIILLIYTHYYVKVKKKVEF